jgi:DNA-binding LytR/AlgR family response regulator
MKILLFQNDQSSALQIHKIVAETSHDLFECAMNEPNLVRLKKAVKTDLLIIHIEKTEQPEGIDLANRIRENDSTTPIIFISSCTDPRFFELAKISCPTAFLLIPFQDISFLHCLELALQEGKSLLVLKKEKAFTYKKNFVFLKIDEIAIRVWIDEIMYIDVMGKYVEIHKLNTETIRLKQAFKLFMDSLDSPLFIQIHRSIAVNMNHIEQIDLKNNTISIQNKKLNVSKSCRQNLINHLSIL